MKLPDSADHGDVFFCDKTHNFKFINHDNERIIDVKIKNFSENFDFNAKLSFKKYPKDDRMLIATPFKENPTRFYYNQKINCMNVSGKVSIGNKEYHFDELNDFGVLDWGRGVWTYKNTWYWGSLSCLVENKRFGFNIGYGFGNTEKATENMLFYDGVAHKLNNVIFKIDETDYLKPWIFLADDDRMNLVMTPILDRLDYANLLIIKNNGHQVFGKFNGYVILDDGTKLLIKDKIGFAEKITNHY
jgi:hypothetical protein